MSDPVIQLVQSCLERRHFFLDLAGRHGSPLYLLEEAALQERAASFQAAFRSELPDFDIFFPVKANSHPLVVKTMVQAGLGLEVSSGMELDWAVQAGSRRILFSGPAKTDDELELALRHHDRVTVIMDSWRELERLAELTSRHKQVISAGVRMAAGAGNSSWGKFGIALDELRPFAEQASISEFLTLEGLQFHTSWNMSPEPQVAMLRLIGSLLADLPAHLRQRLNFLNIGGGFWPEWGEWLPTLPCDGEPSAAGPPFYTIDPAAPIATFAHEIGAAFRSQIFPWLHCRVAAEPGRWICSPAGAILLTVHDLKGERLAVTDGATSMVGGEPVDYCYQPIINLSRPSLTEQPCLITGSLCTPCDRWGYAWFGGDLQCGDLLMLPNAGAYTYSLRQQFIKPLPCTLFLRTDGTITHQTAYSMPCFPDSLPSKN